MSNWQFFVLCGCILFSASLLSGGIYKVLAGILHLSRRAEAVQNSLAEIEMVGLKKLQYATDLFDTVAQK
jgi:hypothetical protein